jgi:CHAT domain-containing protein
VAAVIVLSLPATPTALDDGLLTSSEVAQLKLNADWVVLSACNTAAAEKPGAEALSGLARAFFYAGARAMLVSYWPVESETTVKLMTTAFASIAENPKLTTSETLRQAMLATMDDPANPEWANPTSWAPFVLVGEGGVMTR